MFQEFDPILLTNYAGKSGNLFYVPQNAVQCPLCIFMDHYHPSPSCLYSITICIKQQKNA